MQFIHQTFALFFLFRRGAHRALAAAAFGAALLAAPAQTPPAAPAEPPAPILNIAPGPATAAPLNPSSEFQSATGGPKSELDAANAAYTAGQYAAALELYERLMARGWTSPALLFNAGNAAAQLNRKALAVLYFERALTLTPRDPDIQYNLRLVAPPDNFQPVFILFRPLWFVRHQMRPGELMALGAGFYVLGNLALALAFVARRPAPRRAGRWAGAAALALALFFGGNVWAMRHEQRAAPLGIVMQPAVARGGPGDNFKSVLELPEGLKLHDKGPSGPGWREVQLLTGETAYLPAGVVTAIAHQGVL